MARCSRSKKWLEVICLGSLLGIGFVIPPLWWASIIGIAWVAYSLIEVRTLTATSIWFIWFLKSLLLTSWLWNVYPIDWLGVSLGRLEIPLIGFFWFTVATGLAMGGLFLYAAIKLALQFFGKPVACIFFPISWALAELVGSLGFSFLLFGKGGEIGVSFSMGYSGYLLAEHSILVQLARFGGVYILSVTVAAIAVGLLYLYQRQYIHVVAVIVLLLLGSSQVRFTQTSDRADDGVTIAVVNTQIDRKNQQLSDQIDIEMQNALQVAKAHNPEYIVFPEDTRLFDQTLPSSTLEALVAFQNSDTDAIIVDSGRVEMPEGAVAQAAVFDPYSKKIFQSQKRYLVPQGEFMPYAYHYLFSLYDPAGAATMVNNRLSYVVGQHTSQSHFSTNTPGILFCFEVVNPRGVKTVLSEREGDVPFIAHIISHAWIHDSPTFRRQLTTMLRVQAIWNNIPIIVAGNYAPGSAISAQGVVTTPVAIETGEYWELTMTSIPRPRQQ